MFRFYKSLWVVFCVFTMGCQHTKNKSDELAATQSPPKLLKPEVKKIWIPAVIKNGGAEWEEGHYLYRIEKDTSWSR